MTSAERLLRLAKPGPSRRQTGGGARDGRTCPVEPRHGAMHRLGTRQYCGHQTHDGSSTAPQTRAFWPAVED